LLVKTYSICINASGLLPIPPTKGGGIELVVYEISKRLAEKGIKTFVICTPCGEQKEFFHENLRFINANFFLKSPFCIMKILRRIDLVISEERHNGIASIFFSLHVPVVFHIHNAYPIITREDTSLINYGIDHAMTKTAAIISRHIITASNQIKDELIKEGINHNKITVISNAVDLDKFSPNISGEAVRKKYGLSGKRVLLSVGRISPYKGLAETIKAVSMLDKRFCDVVFLIVGPKFGEAYYRNLLNLVNELNLKERVIFTGNISHSDLSQFYAATDIFLFPTRGEGNPLVLLEAMASGLPIISSNIPSILEILSQKEGLLINTRYSQNIAEAIVKLLDAPEIRLKLGENARKKAEKEFCWEAVCNRLISLLKSLINPEKKESGE
jgi:glycosyltransferase involved in cell wall biosynthesis